MKRFFLFAVLALASCQKEEEEVLDIEQIAQNEEEMTWEEISQEQKGQEMILLEDSTPAESALSPLDVKR